MSAKLDGEPFTAFGGSYTRDRSGYGYTPYALRGFRGKWRPMFTDLPYRYRLYRCWGNSERFYSAIPLSLDYVMRHGGVWYDPKALAVLKNKL